jgi:U32 family peptidase
VQSAARLMPRLLAAGVRRFRIEFVRESTAEAAAVLAAYQALLAGRSTPDAVLGSLHLAAQQGVSAAPMQLLR